METGIVPNQLKIAQVVPIFKGGNKTEISNYRPTSLLPVFSKIFEIQLICCFIAQLVKSLQQRCLYKGIEDILPLVLNTKRPLSDIWLPSYEQNSFGCFLKKLKFWIFSKTPKMFCLYISNQISLRGRFVFKTNGRISSFTSYKDHYCSFFTSWVIKQQKSCILKILKKHPTSGVRCAP